MRLPFFRNKSDAEVPPPQGKFARGGKGAAPAGADDNVVQAARTQARRRLIGALVLLAAGVLGFPVLFETQPRPLPVDTPITLPEGSVVRAVPALPAASKPLPVLAPDAGAETQVTAVTIAASAPPMPAPPPAQPMLVPSPAQPVLVPSPAQPVRVPSPAVAIRVVPDAKPAPVKLEAPKAAASKPAPKPATEPGPATAGRFVVQVGAYNDVERLKAARQRLDKLGFKTYTQDVDTAAGKRTRLRVGPFASRQEAVSVADKVKASGMLANVLTL